MTITLPPEIADLARRRAKALGFANLEQYIATLIAEEAHDQDYGAPEQLKVHSRKDLEGKIQEALNSGPSRVMTPQDWADLRERVAQRVAAARAQTKAS